MVVNQQAPIVNTVGGSVSMVARGTVQGAPRPKESTMQVRSPSGVIETHTIYNARDLINHHKYTAVSAPRLVNNPANVISDTMVQEDGYVDEVMAETSVVEAPTTDAVSNDATNELTALRTEYEKVVGKKPHHFFGKARLLADIEAAQS